MVKRSKMKTNYYPDVSEYILNHPANSDYEWTLGKFLEYAQLHETDLHPSLFIPWDLENNKPLEKPIQGIVGNEQYEGAEMDKYHEAKSKVIFEGFEVWRIVEEVNFIQVEMDLGQSVYFYNNEGVIRYKDEDSVFVNYSEISKVKHLSGKASFTKEINEKFGI